MALFLRRSIGEWSAGTRVELAGRLNKTSVYVRILAGYKPTIEVLESDIVERHKGVRRSHNGGTVS